MRIAIYTNTSGYNVFGFNTITELNEYVERTYNDPNDVPEIFLLVKIPNADMKLTSPVVNPQPVRCPLLRPGWAYDDKNAS